MLKTCPYCIFHHIVTVLYVFSILEYYCPYLDASPNISYCTLNPPDSGLGSVGKFQVALEYSGPRVLPDTKFTSNHNSQHCFYCTGVLCACKWVKL